MLKSFSTPSDYLVLPEISNIPQYDDQFSRIGMKSFLNQTPLYDDTIHLSVFSDNAIRTHNAFLKEISLRPNVSDILKLGGVIYATQSNPSLLSNGSLFRNYFEFNQDGMITIEDLRTALYFYRISILFKLKAKAGKMNGKSLKIKMNDSILFQLNRYIGLQIDIEALELLKNRVNRKTQYAYLFSLYSPCPHLVDGQTLEQCGNQTETKLKQLDKFKSLEQAFKLELIETLIKAGS